MTKSEIIENALNAIDELFYPLSDLNNAMNDLQECDELTRQDKENISSLYMQLSGTGFIEDIKQVLKCYKK